MEQYTTNRISVQINDKLKLIKSNFIELSNNHSNNIFKKSKSASTIIKRPILKRINKLYNEKQNIKNKLDQIGNEASIFNNDKLLTNIKLETIDDMATNDIFYKTTRKDKNNNNIKRSLSKKKYSSPNKKISNKSFTPLNKSPRKRNKKNYYIKKEENNLSSLTLELNCNKMPQPSISSVKTNNYKNSKKKIFGKNNKKNLNLFINKPQTKNLKNNMNNINNINILMTPIPSKNKRSKKMYSNSSFSKLNDSCDNNNDSICLSTMSKMTKTFNKTKSMSINKNITNMHFPNKSCIKNKDKLSIELQKLFTDKIQLYDDTYQNMTDSDKKNCIMFLLEAVKEMMNINKTVESKNDELKEMNKTKEKQIQDDKNEIKELKKDIMKLNKIIKTNLLVNRKLNQKVDSLKIQLEKEKNKNKSNTKKRGITAENKDNKKNRLGQRNKINEFIISGTNHKNINKSMCKIKAKDINIKIDEKNDQYNKETIKSEEKLDISRNKDNSNKDKIFSKEESREMKDKNDKNNFNKDLFLEKHLVKERKGFGNSSDCTNFSYVNNGVNE